MKRFFRNLVIIVLAVLLVSCDVFISLKEGRYNPQDPDNELVELEDLVLPVIRDGFVDDSNNRFFSEPILITELFTQPYAHILIQFDTTDLPEFVELALLELYTTPTTVFGKADVYLIAKSWDETEIQWDQIQLTSGFVDRTIPVVPRFDVGSVDTYISCDVTEYVVRMQETGRHYGFMIVSDYDYYEFDSSRAANPPKLRVWGLAIPE